ncbi:SpoIIE family protein phosphatase, partial [candidate division KSB1 bacterium]|nr:SpoIIE family protein phosphatase [candidate division KSB1 bacterium]
YLTIVDVTGHGITAALLVNRVCNEVRKLIRDQLEPNQIITNLNNFIVDIFSQTGMFLTMFSCMIDLDELKCTYAGNAHPAAILWKKEEDRFQQLVSQNTIVGFDKVKNGEFVQDDIPVAAGDKIFMYTDGLTEIEDRNKKQLGVDGLIRSLENSVQSAAREIPEMIIQNMSACCEGQIRDDIFLIAAEIK